MELGLSLKNAAPIDFTHQTEEAGRFLASSARSDVKSEIRAAAQAFEGYFLSYLMKVMRETIPTGLIENKQERQFYAFYDQEIGRLAAQRGGIGLGQMVEEEITRLNGDLVKKASQVQDSSNR